MSSLSLPEEILSCDYSVPEASSMKLSTEQLNHVWMCPKEARQDLTLSEMLLAMPRGDELQLKAKSEKRGKKERSSFLMRKSHKERPQKSPLGCSDGSSDPLPPYNDHVSAKPCQPPARQQPPLAAPGTWFTPMATGAANALPPEMWRAPCGCYFDLRVFRLRWANTAVPPPANPTGQPWMPSNGCAALQSWVTPAAPPEQFQFVPYKEQGIAVAPVVPSVPTFQQLEGQIQHLNISEAAPGGSSGIPTGDTVPLHSNIPAGIFAAPSPQEIENSLESLDRDVPEEVLLEEAARLFNCSPEMLSGSDPEPQGINHGLPSSIPVLQDLGDLCDLDEIITSHSMSSLSLPEEILSCDYSVPEASSMKLSTEQLNHVWMCPKEARQDLTLSEMLLAMPRGDELQLKAKSEKRGKKERSSFLMRKSHKERPQKSPLGCSDGSSDPLPPYNDHVSAKPCQPPARQQPPLAAPGTWFTPMATGAANALPPEMWRAPCGCYFDLRVFRLRWANTAVPPPANPTGQPWMPSNGCAALQSWVTPAAPPEQFQFVPYKEQGIAVAPVVPSVPTFQQLEGQIQHLNISEAAPGGSSGIPTGDTVPLHSNIPAGIFAAPSPQEAENSLESLDRDVPEEVLLEEAARLFNCSPEMLSGSDPEPQGINHGLPSSIPVLQDLGDLCDLDEIITSHSMNSLSLPEEILSCDYSVPEASSMKLSTEQLNHVWMCPKEARQDLTLSEMLLAMPRGDELQLKAKSEKRGKKERSSFLMRKSHKERPQKSPLGCSDGSSDPLPPYNDHVSAKPCQPPARQQPPLAAPGTWFTPMATGAANALPPEMWRAPCGCYFDLRVFRLRWANTAVPPPANPTGQPWMPSNGCAALQSWVTPAAPPEQFQFVPYKEQGIAVAPVVPSVPTFQQLEGQIQHLNISEAAPGGSSGIPTGDTVPLHSNIPAGIFAAPSPQEIENSLESLDRDVPEEVLLEEAARLFNCSPEMLSGSDPEPQGINHGLPSSIPVLQDLGDLCDLDEIITSHSMSSLSLPEEILSCDYSVPEASSMKLSTEQLNHVWMCPKEARQDLTLSEMLLAMPRGDELQPKAKSEKRGKKERSSFLMRKSHKERPQKSPLGCSDGSSDPLPPYNDHVSAKPCQPPARQQPPLAAPGTWFTPMATGAANALPPEMWRAPCGCYFDLRVFRLRWANTAVPPPANPTGQPWMPSNGCAALQSWVTPAAPPEQFQFVPYKEQGIAVAPVVPSVPTFQQLEGQIQHLNISEAAPGGSSGIPTGDTVPLHSNIPAGIFAAPSPQEIENSLESLDRDVPEEVLLEEAARLFNCSPEMLSGSDPEPQGINHGLPSSIPVLQDLGDLCDLDEIITSHSMSSLSLPEEILSCDYSVPEASSMKLSTEQLNHVWMCPKEARQDLTLSEMLLAMPRGDELQPKAKSEKRGKKERSSFLMRKSHKERPQKSPLGCSDGSSDPLPPYNDHVSAKPCQPPARQQPPLAAPGTWFTPMATGAANALPPEMWRAPCGCYFDLRVFRLRWANTAVPPPANPTGQPWMPSNGCAALQSWVTPAAPPEQFQFVPYKEQGIAVAPVVPSVPTFQQLEGQIQHLNISEAAPGGSSGIPTGDTVPLHSNIPAGIFAAPSPQEIENSLESLDRDVPEEVLLEEAARLFNCSPEMLSGSDPEPQGINHGLPSSIPVLQDLGDLCDLDEIITSHSMSSLSLPEEILSCDYSVPEASSMKLSTEQLNHVWMCPKEARQDLTLSEMLLAMPRGDELQLKAKSEKRGKKERSSFLMRKSHKERPQKSPLGCSDGSSDPLPPYNDHVSAKPCQPPARQQPPLAAPGTWFTPMATGAANALPPG
ncbi:uncharacterized protein LOC136055532 [Cyrtonyx montezumae]|uniref:uncharacterized protein LOC136055532 n=1 Tax=Cyrtonyx montezumae TaxID=9017 RepID=UPI0032DBC19B